MDFREWKKIKNDLYAEDEQLEKGKGYDHNFVIRNKDCGFRKMAEALDEEQGIKNGSLFRSSRITVLHWKYNEINKKEKGE